MEEGGYFTEASTSYNYKSADVQKNVTGFGVQAGIVLHIAGKFCAEMSGGFGFKSVTIVRELIMGLNKQEIHQYVPAFKSEDEFSDRGALMYIPAAFAITYGLGKAH